METISVTYWVELGAFQSSWVWLNSLTSITCCHVGWTPRSSLTKLSSAQSIHFFCFVFRTQGVSPSWQVYEILHSSHWFPFSWKLQPRLPRPLCTGSLEYVLPQGPYMGNEVPIFLPRTDWPKGEPLTPNGPIRDFPRNLALGLEGPMSEGCLWAKPSNSGAVGSCLIPYHIHWVTCVQRENQQRSRGREGAGILRAFCLLFQVSRGLASPCSLKHISVLIPASPLIPSVRFRRFLLPASRVPTNPSVNGQASVLISETWAGIPANPRCSQQCCLYQKKGQAGQGMEHPS